MTKSLQKHIFYTVVTIKQQSVIFTMTSEPLYSQIMRAIKSEVIMKLKPSSPSAGPT